MYTENFVKIFFVNSGEKDGIHPLTSNVQMDLRTRPYPNLATPLPMPAQAIHVDKSPSPQLHIATVTFVNPNPTHPTRPLVPNPPAPATAPVLPRTLLQMAPPPLVPRTHLLITHKNSIKRFNGVGFYMQFLCWNFYCKKIIDFCAILIS